MGADQMDMDEALALHAKYKDVIPHNKYTTEKGERVYYNREGWTLRQWEREGGIGRKTLERWRRRYYRENIWPHDRAAPMRRLDASRARGAYVRKTPSKVVLDKLQK